VYECRGEGKGVSAGGRPGGQVCECRREGKCVSAGESF
jgi:hypothetical protein